jgi:site-specific recombinase XerD
VQSLANWSAGQVVGQPDASFINVKLRQILNDYDQRLEHIVSPDLYSCLQLRDKLKAMRPLGLGLTFMEYARHNIDELIKDKRTTTAGMRQRQVNKFSDFLGGDIPLSDITPATVTQYQRWLNAQGNSIAYNGMQLTAVKTIINAAIRDGSVKYDIHPFAYYTQQQPEPREMDIPVEDLRKIRDYETKYKGERKARDLFMLSYYLGGINLIDLMAYDFRGKDTMEYIRTKTRNKKKSNRTVSFSIPEEAFPIINHYMSPKTGKLDFGTNGNYDTFKNIVTRDIKRIAKKLGIRHADKVCFYTARKSFVQHGFDLGISLEVLEYCIGQSMKADRPIFNYLKIMRRHADNAIRQILDHLAEKESGDPHEQPDNNHN